MKTTACSSIVRVTFLCPTCRHEWEGAHLQPGAWWSTMTPDVLAGQVWCRQCHAPPPMQWRTDDQPTQGTLL